ncbi:MAG: hypothetical protein DMF99_13940 [Acidobacteria bacterium]|nr:MAG: hypothetical protein DMF99_13940 [Acidobacteriota bacterium]
MALGAAYSIVTPTFEHASSIADYLDATLRSASLPFHWIIVDDGSRDGTADRVEAWLAAHPSPRIARATVIRNQRPMFETACDNIGFRVAETDVVIENQAVAVVEVVQALNGRFSRSVRPRDRNASHHRDDSRKLVSMRDRESRAVARAETRSGAAGLSRRAALLPRQRRSRLSPAPVRGGGPPSAVRADGHSRTARSGREPAETQRDQQGDFRPVERRKTRQPGVPPLPCVDPVVDAAAADQMNVEKIEPQSG